MKQSRSEHGGGIDTRAPACSPGGLSAPLTGDRRPTATATATAMAIYLALLAGLGCSGPGGYPAVPATTDPDVHALYLVAFGADGHSYLVLERLVRPHLSPAAATGTGTGQELELVAFQIKTKRRERLATLDQDLRESLLTSWPPRSRLSDRIRQSATGLLIEQLGYLWPLQHPGDRLTTSVGTLQAEADTIVFSADDQEVDVQRLTGVEPADTPLWLMSPDGAQVGLELAFGGHPLTRTLHVLGLAGSQARLLSKKAHQAHQEEHFEQSARLWLQARRLNPDSTDLAYNVACAEARLGHHEDAIRSLDEAIRLGGDRYRSWARQDRDLAPLWEMAEFQAIVRRQTDR